MARKRHTAEEIVSKLRQVDVLMAQGRPVADAVRAIESGAAFGMFRLWHGMLRWRPPSYISKWIPRRRENWWI